MTDLKNIITNFKKNEKVLDRICMHGVEEIHTLVCSLRHGLAIPAQCGLKSSFTTKFLFMSYRL